MTDENEITRPGTPDALATLRDLHGMVTAALRELRIISERLARLETAQKTERSRVSALESAVKADKLATDRAIKFERERLDRLVPRVQGLER